MYDVGCTRESQRYLRRVLSWFGDRVSHWLNWSSPINYTQWPAIPESQNLHASIFQHWYYTSAPHRFSHVRWGSKLRSPCFHSKQLPKHPLPSPPINFIVTFLSLVHHVRYRRAEGYKMCLLICSSWHYSEPHLNIIEEYSTPLYGPSLSSLKNWYVLCKKKAYTAVWKAKDNQIDSIHAVPLSISNHFHLGGLWRVILCSSGFDSLYSPKCPQVHSSLNIWNAGIIDTNTFNFLVTELWGLSKKQLEILLPNLPCFEI